MSDSDLEGMHYHLLAGFDSRNIVRESFFTDFNKSVDAYVGLVDALFEHKDQDIEIIRQRMKEVAMDPEVQLVFIGSPGTINLFWIPCTHDLETEARHIPVRN